MKMNQNGKVPVWLIVVGALFGVVVVICGGIATYFLGTYNTCKRYENELDAVYKQNQSVMANSFYGPLETAGLAEKKYKDAVATMARVGVEGWQGATGGKAMMLWLNESFPKIDPEIYKKLIDIAERGLGKFEKVQTDLLDRGRSYKDYLVVEPRGFVCRMFGFPKIDLDKILTPVTDESTDKSFETKRRVKPDL